VFRDTRTYLDMTVTSTACEEFSYFCSYFQAEKRCSVVQKKGIQITPASASLVFECLPKIHVIFFRPNDHFRLLKQVFFLRCIFSSTKYIIMRKICIGNLITRILIKHKYIHLHQLFMFTVEQDKQLLCIRL